MKGSVIQNYVDVQTGKAYLIGNRIEYADDRARFLAEKGYIKLDDVEKAEPVEKVEKRAAKVETPKKPAAKKTTITKKTTKK